MSKLRTFYQSCLDTETIRAGGYQPAVEFIKQHFSAYLQPSLGDSGDLTDVIHGELSPPLASLCRGGAVSG